MKWSYDDPSKIKKDEVRLIIGDTDQTYIMLYDEEIEYFLNKNNEDTEATAYHCAKAILHRLSYEPNYTIGPESVSNASRLKILNTIVESLNPANSGIPWPPQPGTPDIFHIGMFDNDSGDISTGGTYGSSIY